MNVLVFGAAGQVGTALRRTAPPELRCSWLTSRDCDIADAEAVKKAVEIHEANLIINAAAFTAVDLAEAEESKAFSVNERGPANLAASARLVDSRLIHISTDFVFDGAASSPIRPTDPVRPLGVYGASKLAGERAALKGNPGATAVVRTSWVYSSSGSNFVKTMLRLMSEKDELSVVADQTGSPTWAMSLADAIWGFASQPVRGDIYHWSDAGATTWFDFAVEIQRQATGLGLLRKQIPILPISTEQYPTPATRPRYSVLDCTSSAALLGYDPAPWRVNLEKMLTELSP